MRHKLSMFILAIIACFIFIGCEPDSALPQNEVPDTSEVNIDEEKETVEINEELEENHAETTNDDEIGKLPEEDEVTEVIESTVDIVDNNIDEGNQEEETNLAEENTEIAPQTNQPTEQNEENDSSQIEEKPSVTVQIFGVDQDGNPRTIVSPTEVELLEGDTVHSVTVRVLDQFGIQRSIRGSGSMTYVEGIDNLYEFDFGPLSGWQYLINGYIKSRSSGVEQVANGDIIEWKYFLNFTNNN